MTSSADYVHSSLRESLIEHLFVGEVLRHLWLCGPKIAEVMKPQVDATGYDLAIECGGFLRHIQLKSSARTASTSRQKIHVALGEKPSGCVVWVQFDAETLELGPFLFFGGAPGQPLPSLKGLKTAKHTKGDAKGHKAERPNHRVLPKGRFEAIPSIEEFVEVLFGELDQGGAHLR